MGNKNKTSITIHRELIASTPLTNTSNTYIKSKRKPGIETRCFEVIIDPWMPIDVDNNDP